MDHQRIGLGSLTLSDQTAIFYKEKGEEGWQLHIAFSKDGVEIHTQEQVPVLTDLQGENISAERITYFSPSGTTPDFHLLYSTDEQGVLFHAISRDGVSWQTTHQLHGLTGNAILCPPVSQIQYAFVGIDGIHLASSTDGITWQVEQRPIVAPHADKYGSLTLDPHIATITPTGILLIYLAKGREIEGHFYSLHAVFLDSGNPTVVIQKSHPLWEQTDEWIGTHVTPIGVVYFHRQLISYWDFHEEGLFAITHASLKHVTDSNILTTNLERLVENPLLTPISAHYWESKATFNPAAVTIDGKVHMLYRAIGDTDVSVMGYAVGSDGITFDRLAKPAYIPRESFEGAPEKPHKLILSPSHYSPYESGGGGWGGCEDPRLTQIDDKLYLVYVAYNGWGPPRVALSSITVDNFVNNVWDWAKPVLISPPNVVDKNAVIFPEKVNGKYVVLHRIYPNILLDYVDSLDFDGETFLKGEYKIAPTRAGWDNRKIGAGAPPIKTKDGWLLIYHSVGEADPGRYKMGAMLLDLHDPTKVLYRTVSPILAPDHEHENNGWKSGVAYPCGAVVVDGNLYIYYGGADMVVCAASANLEKFIADLKESGTVSLQPMYIHTKYKVK